MTQAQSYEAWRITYQSDEQAAQLRSTLQKSCAKTMVRPHQECESLCYGL